MTHRFPRRLLIGLAFTGLAASLSPEATRADAPVKLTVMAYGVDAFDEKYLRTVIRPFETAHPDIEVGYYAVRDSRNALSVLRAQRAAPRIDIVILDPPNARLAQAERLIEPMDPKRIPNAADLGKMGRELGFWALPAMYDSLTLVYAKSAFAQPPPPPELARDVGSEVPGQGGRGHQSERQRQHDCADLSRQSPGRGGGRPGQLRSRLRLPGENHRQHPDLEPAPQPVLAGIAETGSVGGGLELAQSEPDGLAGRLCNNGARRGHRRRAHPDRPGRGPPQWRGSAGVHQLFARPAGATGLFRGDVLRAVQPEGQDQRGGARQDSVALTRHRRQAGPGGLGGTDGGTFCGAARGVADAHHEAGAARRPKRPCIPVRTTGIV